MQEYLNFTPSADRVEALRGDEHVSETPNDLLGRTRIYQWTFPDPTSPDRAHENYTFFPYVISHHGDDVALLWSRYHPMPEALAVLAHILGRNPELMARRETPDPFAEQG
jgi:hypothetical protein